MQWYGKIYPHVLYTGCYCFVTAIIIVMEDKGKKEILDERLSTVSNDIGKKCTFTFQYIIVVSVVFAPILYNCSCH